LEITDLFEAQQFRRFMKVAGELLDGMHVAANGIGALIAALEFLQHPLT